MLVVKRAGRAPPTARRWQATALRRGGEMSAEILGRIDAFLPRNERGEFVAFASCICMQESLEQDAS